MTSSGVDNTSAGGPVLVFDHLVHLTDERGLFEHAEHLVPRREHGYCVDDAARGLVVVCREPAPGPVLGRLARCYLDFVLDAFAADGTCRNRMDATGEWRDQPDLGDWWGRALWGLGVAAVSARTAGLRARALSGFRVAAQQRSPNIRSTAFAVLGAAEVLAQRPHEVAARALLCDGVRDIGAVPNDRNSDSAADTVIPMTAPSTDWIWPEPRLTYGNGTLAEALIVGGRALDDEDVLDQGLQRLEFLLGIETRDGHLSVTPVSGRGHQDVGPAFDQQPIEVASLADACASAYRVTRDRHWLGGVALAWNWFTGDNDSATPMFDPVTGGGYDGLLVDGRNLNQGAESTLAMLSTAQHARDLL